MNRRTRSFLGYPVPAHQELDKLCAQLPKGWRLIHPADRHLTLLFLGDIDDQQRDLIWTQARHQLPPGGEYPALSLSGFGHPRSPRTLALTLTASPIADWILQRSPALCALSGRQPEQREPRPHVSLAHWAGSGSPCFESLPSVSELTIPLQELALFQRAPTGAANENGLRYRCWTREPL